ncbi:hypothetical protein [Prosthecobacter sp.]|uniref:hypothetical protein n=1 Tax=Prosthecobacter sp. TaxID=1965333 RepID=UPI003784EEA7
MQIVLAILAKLVCSVIILHLWAVVSFLFFRFARPETPERQRRFLEKRFFFYTFRPFSQDKKNVTPEAVREAGRNAWNMVFFPLILLNRDITPTFLWLSIGFLYIGGLQLAWAWYGLRCLRMLGLEAYEKAAV